MNAPDLFSLMDTARPAPAAVLRATVARCLAEGAPELIEQPAPKCEPRRYACPACRNTVTLLLPHTDAPRCAAPTHLRAQTMKETTR